MVSEVTQAATLKPLRRTARGVISCFLAAALLAACISVPVGGDFCAVEHPTRLSEKTIDAMTDAEVNDALAHNRKGEKLCGWKPNA